MHWLADDAAADAFPPVAQALADPPGLLAAGGDLSPERILAAYERGIFPWYSEHQPILWWSPDPRMVLYPEEFHCSRSLERTLRSGRFETRLDGAFGETIRACAGPRRASLGTWLNPAMIGAYETLHAMGHAHSVETWRDGRLVGGLYGLALGQVFFGESMFSRESDASKVAFARLVEECRHRAIGLIDCQVASAHLERLGAREIPRDAFLASLGRLARRTPAIWR
ncbi:MAG: leucyl/phenylalanyl-tRNA--protein transferase [Gammaproteobacteria bacterium]|nr:leucyl/phenylalanyl-tRNA--protein transferase [Gammaproteobacteria bacterium]